MADEFPDPRTKEYYLQRFEELRQSLSPAALARIAEMKALQAQLLHGNLDDNPEGLSGGTGKPAPIKPSPPALPGANARALSDRSEVEPSSA